MRIFLSYASEDYSLVQPYYNKLKNLGLRPWMDKKELSPGMKWENFIWAAIRQSDLIIIFLSSNSVSKRGFFQKEIKKALQIWEEKLEDDIFLIPARLDDCDVPDRLSKFQYTNLYESNGWDKLVESIKYASNKLNIDFPQKPKKLEMVTKKFKEQNTKNFTYDIYCEYPELHGDKKFDEVNQIISGSIFEEIQSFRKHALERFSDKTLRDTYGGTNLKEKMNVEYDVSYLSNKLISIFFNFWFYSIGAAHGNGYQKTFNFEINPTLYIKLEDMFKKDSNYLNIISNYCTNELCREAIDMVYFNEQHDFINGFVIEPIKRGTAPKKENYKNFVLTDDTLKILFDVYQAGCFAEGHKFVDIPLSQLKDIAKNKGTIYRLLDR